MRRILGAVALAVFGWSAAPSVPAQGPGLAPGVASYPLGDFGVRPRSAFREVLLGFPAVREELKLTEAQAAAVEAAYERHAERLDKARDEMADRRKFGAARAVIFRETAEALAKALEPAQLARLDQIQLRAQGPLAFKGGPPALLALEGGDLRARLKLDDDQVKRVGAIAAEGEGAIEKASAIFVVLPPGVARTPEAIDQFVASPEFQAAKRNVREAARVAWDDAIRRIEGALTEAQRASYRELIGPPFDLARLRPPGDESARDAQEVSQALDAAGVAEGPPMMIEVGVLAPVMDDVPVVAEVVVADGGGVEPVQRADPDFDPAVARPAYRRAGPRVLFDEAHANFHTAEGRYRPFAQLIGNDGYAVTPASEKFSAEGLAKGDILIVANAESDGPEGTAITEGEADAVRDWVRAGGSLLLITDRPPHGEGARLLADRFGVEMGLAQTSDPDHSRGHPANLVFGRDDGLLGDHPILRGRDDAERVGRVLTFAGQSLRGPLGCVPLLKLGEAAVDGAGRSAAGRAQGLAFRSGRGRVVVLGEAAMLSAQTFRGEPLGMNVPGSDDRQFALNIMHWLSGLLEPDAGPK